MYTILVVLSVIIVEKNIALLTHTPKDTQKKEEKLRVVGGYILFTIITIIIIIQVYIPLQILCCLAKIYLY